MLDESVRDEPGQLSDLLVFVLQLVLQRSNFNLALELVQCLLIFFQHALANLVPSHLLDALLLLVFRLIEVLRVLVVGFELLADFIIDTGLGRIAKADFVIAELVALCLRLEI